MKHSVIRHCRAAATSFVIAAAFAAADPATDAPALLPEPFSALRLGMDEAAFRAARPDAKRDEDRARIWPETAHYEEKPEGGLFPFAFFALADAPDGARTLEWAMFFGEPPEGEPAGASAAAALRDAESRLGPAQRRFELIRWGAVFDVRAWETDGAVAVCSTVSRTLDPDDCEENTAGNFLFGAFRRAAIERLPTPYDDLSVVVLAALARPASEDSRPVPWVDLLPGTNRIDRYELDGTPVSTREPADAVLSLVSDYGSFPATVERDDFAPGKAHPGFVELGFSGRGVDIDDPKWLYLSRDCATLRVDEADYLSFSVPEDRRASLRAAVAALAPDSATPSPSEKTSHAESAESAEEKTHAESAEGAEKGNAK